MVQFASDPWLERVTGALIEGVRPTRVILFGSRARGDARPDSDYDLAVELPFDDFHECRGRVRGVIRDIAAGIDVDLLIRAPGQIEARRNDPGYMDWDIAREGIVLYPPGIDSSALRPRRMVRESEPFRSIADWLARAAEDQHVIDAILEAGQPTSWSGVCFHAQQLAEKHLKVLFILRGVRPPRTHDLTELIAGLRGIGVRIAQYADECASLDGYAVDVRYPEHVPLPDEQTGRRALAAARIIVAAAAELGARSSGAS